MIRVVKVGGSLFDFDGLVEHLQQWFAAQSPAVHVLLAGGGTLADVIRMADGRFCLGEEPAHWLAIETLGISARMLHAILPGTVLAREFADLDMRQVHSSIRHLSVLEPVQFMRDVEPKLPGCQLPRSWQVTSDSIAARVAQALRADELVLLKSGLPPADASRDMAAAEGYVDAYFPIASRDLPLVRCVDFRNDDWPEVKL